MQHDVFVSYSTKDIRIAEAVCNALEQNGIRCWIAPRDILPGMEYADAIIEALNTCRVFLVILSAESNTSPQVRREVERAVSKDLSILTFRIDDTILSKAMEYYLSNRHWLDASKVEFSKQLGNLADAVQKLLAQTSVAAPKTIPTEPAASLGKTESVPPAVEQAIPSIPGVELKSTAPMPLVTEVSPAPEGVAVTFQKTDKRKKSPAWILWTAVLTIVIGGMVALYLVFFKDQFKPIPKVTSVPINTPAPPAIEAASYGERLTHEILDEISTHSPNFQDDFSSVEDSTFYWNDVTGGLSFGDGVMTFDTSGTDDSRVAAAGPLVAKNFVLQYDLTLRTYTLGSYVCSDFRYGIDGLYHFCIDISGDTWGMGISATGDDWTNLLEGNTNKVYIKTSVGILARGSEFAFTIDTQYRGYQWSSSYDGNLANIVVVGPADVPTIIDVDNVHFWNLDNLLP
jgi:hypothetical protein